MSYSFISMSQIYDLALSGGGSGSISASYALTASYAENGGGGVGGYVTGSFTNQDTWSFAHNLGSQYVSFEIFDSNNNVIIPQKITAIDINNANIYFPITKSGMVAAGFAGTTTTGQIISSSYSLTSSYTENALTSSYAITALSSSYAVSSSYSLSASSAVSSSHSISASSAVSSSYSVSASSAVSTSFSTNALTASYSVSASSAVSSSYSISASSAVSTSFSANALTASYSVSASSAVSSSYALSASSAVSTSFSTNALTASYALNGGAESYWTASGTDITRMGNIGIGTTSPDKRIHIKGDSTSADIVFETTGYSTKGYFAHYQGNTLQLSLNRRIDGVFSNTGQAAPSINLISGVSNSYISFYTTPTNNSNPIERLTITKDGYVHVLQRIGIGTVSPGNSLDVVSGQILGPNGSVVAGNAPGIAFTSYADTGFAANADNLAIYESGVISLNLSNSTKEFRVPSDYKFAFSSATNNNAISDTSFYRSASGLLVTDGNFIAIGSITASQGFFGTSSYAINSLTASYAVTASYALNGGGGGSGASSGFAATQSFTNEPTWSFTHNLGTKYLAYEIYDDSDEVIIPDRIVSDNINTATIYFPVTQSGMAIATYGVATSSISSSYALTASYAENGGGGGGGGVTIVNYSTYQDLLSASSSAASGAFGTVSNMANALFFKLGDWFALSRAHIFGATSDTTWWIPMEGNGNDISLNEYHGVETSMSYATGKVGQAGVFNGTDSQISSSVLVTDSIAGVTISCWVYLSSTSLKGAFVKNGTTYGYGVGVGGTTLDNTGNNLIMVFDGPRWIPTGKPIGTGWHHIVFILDESSKPSAYIDGILVYSDTGTNPTTPVGGTHIGGYLTGRYLSGSIDEVIIENRVWNTYEITDYYNMTR